MSICLLSLIETAKVIIGSTSIVNYGSKPYRENEAMDLRCSIDKFIRLTESSDSVAKHLMKSCDDGLRETINWMNSVQ